MPALPQDIRAVQREFDAALIHQKKRNLNADEQRFLKQVADLKTFVVERMEAGDKGFDSETCLPLAKRTKNLTLKILRHQATEVDVASFNSENAKLRSMSTTAKVLTTMLAALAGIAAGIVAGFLIAGVLGAVIGGAAAGVAAASGTALGIFRTNAVDKVCNSAGLIVAKNADNSSSSYLADDNDSDYGYGAEKKAMFGAAGLRASGNDYSSTSSDYNSDYSDYDSDYNPGYSPSYGG